MTWYTGATTARVHSEMCDEVPNPQDAFIRQPRAERVRQAVARLPAKYGHLVRLRYFEELNPEEIAAELQ